MQRSIDGLHGKTVNVLLHAAGNGSIYFNQSTGVGGDVKGGLKFMAGGGAVTGGTAGRDSVLAALMPGELIVPAGMVQSGAVDHLRGRLPGFAAGGLVTSSPGGMGNWMGGVESSFGRSVEDRFAVTLYGNLKTAVKRAAAQQAMAGLNYLPLGSGGPVSASASVAQQFAKSIMFAYGWGPGQWPYLQALWNRESGWNSYAANPTSNARGIPQNINGWSAYRPGDYQAQVRWGDAYISSRYGTPSNAWAHELAFNWYDQGGYLPPGLSLAYNGTGQPERVPGPGGGGNTYNISITLPPGSDRDQGRRIVGYIRQYEKGSGPGWRK
jgi:hypothetical protein